MLQSRVNRSTRPGTAVHAMDRDYFVLLWIDRGEPQCSLYEDEEQAAHDAALVGGRVEVRTVHRSERLREGRFVRGEG